MPVTSLCLTLESAHSSCRAPFTRFPHMGWGNIATVRIQLALIVRQDQLTGLWIYSCCNLKSDRPDLDIVHITDPMGQFNQASWAKVLLRTLEVSPSPLQHRAHTSVFTYNRSFSAT